jgi:rubrerythrin
MRKLDACRVRRNIMPEFGSPFSGLANNKKLTDEELVRAIRFMVAAEYEATQLYIQLAESTDNRLAVAVLKEIADEELVHAGEFLRLLHQLAPNEAKLYAQGAKEVDELIESVTLSAPPQSRNRLLSGASG